MSINLTIDHGNSRTKLALWGAGDCHPRQMTAMKTVTAAALDEFCGGKRPTAVCMCSVAGTGDEELRALLEAKCERLLVIDPATTPTPLRVAYRTPSTLGADRLAAAVAAWQLAEASEVLVVDVGTAVTYDYVRDGVFIGGNIAPGIGMRLRALNRYTARLPLVESGGTVETWGGDTSMALRAGAVDGVVAEVEYYAARLGSQGKVILTGGASGLVAPRLSFAAERVSDLVCLGLNIIAAYNFPDISL